MSDEPPTDRDETFLAHLEQRRTAFEGAMWQAPALTLAAQAFLLSVLTDEGVSWGARLFILIGGLAAIWAALASLIRLRSREVLYSDAIAHEFDRRGLCGIRGPTILSGSRWRGPGDGTSSTEAFRPGLERGECPCT